MGFAKSIGLFAHGLYRLIRTIYATWAPGLWLAPRLTHASSSQCDDRGAGDRHNLKAIHIVQGYVATISNTYQYQMSVHINQQSMTTTTISALSSETSRADGGQFTTTYTAL